MSLAEWLWFRERQLLTLRYSSISAKSGSSNSHGLCKSKVNIKIKSFTCLQNIPDSLYLFVRIFGFHFILTRDTKAYLFVCFGIYSLCSFFPIKGFQMCGKRVKNLLPACSPCE